MRKLTKREKISLTVLMLLGFSYFYIQYLVIPQLGSLKEVRAELDSAKKEVEKVENYKSTIDKLESNIGKESEKLNEEIKMNFTELNQEDVILLVDNIASESGIVNEGMNFDKPSLEAMSEQEVELNTAEISFQGGYHTLSDFLERLSKYDKKILVDRIKVDRDSDDILTGTIFMKMYSLDGVVEDTTALFDWHSDSEYLTSNPFSPFASYINATKKESAEENGSTSADTTSGSSTGNATGTGSTTPSASTPSASGSSTAGSNSTGSAMKTATPSASKPMMLGGSDFGFNAIDAAGPLGTGAAQIKPETSILGVQKSTLESFENARDFFVTGSPRAGVISVLELNGDKRDGSSSLNLKYNFLEERKLSSLDIKFANKVYADDSQSKISLDVKPFVKSSHKMGVVIKDSRGNLYDLELSKRLDWNGWKTLEKNIPSEASFPIEIEKIYMESRDYDKTLSGDLLLDNLQMVK